MTAKKSPRVDDAPGLIWRKRADGWAAIWQCRTDLAKRGYPTKSKLVTVIVGEEPTEAQRAFIVDTCRFNQDNMLMWGRAKGDVAPTYFGTLASLIECYKSDPDSPYRQVRHKTRQNYDAQCRRIETDHGDELVSGIKARTLRHWHQQWSPSGVTAAHSLVSQLRKLVGFGTTLLECDECARLCAILREMKFKMGKPREETLTAEQVIAIRAKAHKFELPSIALAQAFQFECTLRQKDVIGEWVPMNEPGELSDIHRTEKNGKQLKWLRGLRWSEIDGNFMLRHMTSKRQKEIKIDLRHAPMVLEEFKRIYGMDDLDRSKLPVKGACILFDGKDRPYGEYEFRRRWRDLARACGIPDTIYNMDSRAGAITEALNSGARLQSVRKAATHSDESMTQRYSRGDEQAIAEVMQLRAKNRNTPGT